MSQAVIDEREWGDPRNWRWTFYYSRKDSRTFVPRRRGYGATLNFASRGAFWFFLFLMLMPLVIVGAVLLGRAV